MGNENNVNRMDPNNVDINDWVCISSPGGRYLGRLAGALNPGNEGGGAEGLSKEKFSDEYLKDMKARTLQAMADGDLIELSPAFDFLAPLRPIPSPDGRGMVMTRDPVIVTVDFTVQELPVFVKGTNIYFLADLKGNDRNTYKEFVAMGMSNAMEARIAQAGLVSAGTPLVGSSGKVTPIRG